MKDRDEDVGNEDEKENPDDPMTEADAPGGDEALKEDDDDDGKETGDDVDATDKAEDKPEAAATSAADAGHGDTDKETDLKMANREMMESGVNEQQNSKDRDNAGLAESQKAEDGHSGEKVRFVILTNEYK